MLRSSLARTGVPEYPGTTEDFVRPLDPTEHNTRGEDPTEPAEIPCVVLDYAALYESPLDEITVHPNAEALGACDDGRRGRAILPERSVASATTASENATCLS
jgi:hypothetical protein